MSFKPANGIVFVLFLLLTFISVSYGSLLSILFPGKIPDYGETALNEGILNIFIKHFK